MTDKKTSAIIGEDDSGEAIIVEDGDGDFEFECVDEYEDASKQPETITDQFADEYDEEDQTEEDENKKQQASFLDVTIMVDDDDDAEKSTKPSDIAQSTNASAENMPIESTSTKASEPTKLTDEKCAKIIETKSDFKLVKAAETQQLSIGAIVKTNGNKPVVTKPTESKKNAATTLLAVSDEELDYNDTTPTPTSVNPKNTVVTSSKSSSSKNDRELRPKRTEAEPNIASYVQSLIKLEFDVKKYTCFYCNPCRAFLTTTAQWEEHIIQTTHRRNVCLWRECLDLLVESSKERIASVQTEIDNHSDVVVGADNVIEIANKPGGTVRSWVCARCVCICPTTDQLLAHLSSFDHIDNVMEKIDPGLYRPPGRFDQVHNFIRARDSEQRQSLIEDARQRMDRSGRGQLKTYTGDRFQDWTSTDHSEAEDLEEQLVMDKMEQLFSDDYDINAQGFKYDIIPNRRSIANHDFDKMKDDGHKSMIGMQYMLEIWTPSRKVTPVYYCILCEYLVTNWTVHCTILKHCVAYLMKHYKSVFECILLESSAEDEFRRALTMARDKVLMLEGRRMRVQHVVQIHGKADDVFVPINARIAKSIVTVAKMNVPSPERAKRLSNAKTSVSSSSTKRVTTTSSKDRKDVKSSSKPIVNKTNSSSANVNHKPNAVDKGEKSRPTGSSKSTPTTKDAKKTTNNSRVSMSNSTASKTTRIASSSSNRRRSPTHRSPPSRRRSSPPRCLVTRAPDRSTARYHHRTFDDRPTASHHDIDRRRHRSSSKDRTSSSSRHHTSVISKRPRRARLSVTHLAELEKLLASIGVMVERRLTEQDVDRLELELGPSAMDELVNQVLSASTTNANDMYHQQFMQQQPPPMMPGGPFGYMPPPQMMMMMPNWPNLQHAGLYPGPHHRLG